jgi:hypothetical protein
MIGYTPTGMGNFPFDPSFNFQQQQPVGIDDFPQAQLDTDPVADALIAKKKKSWLDALASNLAGDRYLDTTEDDRRLAINNAMIEMGRHFSAAGAKGDWGAIGTAIGSGLGDASQAFQGTMGELSKRRVANKIAVDAEKLRGMQIEEGGIDLANKKDKRGDDIATREMVKDQLDDYDAQFAAAIADDDIPPAEKKARDAQWSILKKMAQSDPTNPERFAAMGNFFIETSAKAGRKEDALALVGVQIAAAAKAAGVSEFEILKKNNLGHFQGLQEAVYDLESKKLENENKKKYGRVLDTQADENAADALTSGTGNKDNSTFLRQRLNSILNNPNAMGAVDLMVNGLADEDTKKIAASFGIFSVDQARDLQRINAGGGMDFSEYADKGDQGGAGQIGGHVSIDTPETLMSFVKSDPEVARGQAMVHSNPRLRIVVGTKKTPAEIYQFFRDVASGKIK